MLPEVTCPATGPCWATRLLTRCATSSPTRRALAAAWLEGRAEAEAEAEAEAVAEAEAEA